MSGNRSDIWPAKDAWLLREVDAGRSILEIARVLGIADTTVRRRLWHLRPETYTSRSGKKTATPATIIPDLPARETTRVDAPRDRDESDDIPVIFEEPRDTERPPAPEWTAARASREHLLERQLGELKKQNEKLLDEIHIRDAQLDVANALREVAPITGKPRAPGSKRHGVPVMLCSDWHIEEEVREETVNGLNRYDLEIANECIERMADAYVWMLLDSRYDCREGVVWLGGDLVSGYIHEELAEQNQLSPVEASLWLFQRLIRFFTRLLAETNLERIIVPCNDGNHGRLTRKMRVSTRTENSLEWLLYQQLAAHFANEPRLQFQIAEGVSNYLDVYGTKICFQHGDTFKYQGGVGGLLIPVRRGFNELRKYRNVDHLVIGHFHQRLDAGDVVVNGSAIGITPYGMSIKAAPEPRQQSWFIVDQERGKSISAPIWLPQTAVL